MVGRRDWRQIHDVMLPDSVCVRRVERGLNLLAPRVLWMDVNAMNQTV